MCLIAKVIRISRAKFYCNRLATVQDIQDYASLIFLAHSVVALLRYRNAVMWLHVILSAAVADIMCSYSALFNICCHCLVVAKVDLCMKYAGITHIAEMH